MDLSYIINQLGEERENYFNAIAPPIIQTSNFASPNVEKLREALSDEYSHTLYSRGNNPTLDILRKKLAALDGAEDALVFSSGVAAIFVAVFANLKQGDHIVSVAKPYSWTNKLFNDLLPRFGVTTTMIDCTRIENFENAIHENTKIIFLESPNTFTFELQPISQEALPVRSFHLSSRFTDEAANEKPGDGPAQPPEDGERQLALRRRAPHVALRLEQQERRLVAMDLRVRGALDERPLVIPRILLAHGLAQRLHQLGDVVDAAQRGRVVRVRNEHDLQLLSRQPFEKRVGLLAFLSEIARHEVDSTTILLPRAFTLSAVARSQPLCYPEAVLKES
jgi:hypothetical protein